MFFSDDTFGDVPEYQTPSEIHKQNDITLIFCFSRQATYTKPRNHSSRPKQRLRNRMLFPKF